jgi:hypothetical protein
MSPGPRRLLVANLDAESEMRGVADPRAALPRRVAVLLSALGTLLRAFARDGDRLWTPLPVARERVPEVAGLPRPALLDGPLARVEGARPAAPAEPGGSVLAWAETASVAALRAACAAREGEASTGTSTSTSTSTSTDDLRGPLHEVLWRLPPPSPPLVAEVHDRRHALEGARELGCLLPGARTIGALDELEHHLAAGGASAAPGERWVLKAPLSAAGRARVLGRGRALLDGPARRAAAALLQVHGELVFEPWMERAGDFGAAALVSRGALRVLGVHRLEVDGAGRFRGVEIESEAPEAAAGDPPGAFLSPREDAILRDIVERVGARLAARGYTGPFGIDAWRYRDANGRSAFQPLGELNARMTFGLVARALLERLLGAPGATRPGGASRSPGGAHRRARLRLARAGVPLPRPGLEVVPLVLPGGPPEEGSEDLTAVWLEIE